MLNRLRRVPIIFGICLAMLAASCGSGDDSAGSRTRNSGAAPTLEECYLEDPWYSEQSDEELANWQEQLIGDVEELQAILDEAKRVWVAEGAQSQEQILALNAVSQVIDEARTRGISLYGEISEEEQAWLEEQFDALFETLDRSDEAFMVLAQASFELSWSQQELALLEAVQANQAEASDSSNSPEPTTPAPTTSATPTTTSVSIPEEGPETSVWVDDTDTSIWLEDEDYPHSTLPMDDHHADGPDEVIENHEENLNEISLEEQKIKDLTQKIEEQRQLTEQLEEARLEAMRETDGVVEKLSGEELAYEGDWESASQEEQDSYAVLHAKVTQDPSQEAIDMLHSAEENERAASEKAEVANGDLYALEQELQDAYENYDAAVNQAVDDQNTGVQDYGDATSQVANMSADMEEACFELGLEMEQEELAKLVATLEDLRLANAGLATSLDEDLAALVGGGTPEGGENSPSTDSLLETADEREEVTDLIPGSQEIALELDAIPVALDDDTQVQIPTSVVLADEAVVEIEEIVNEIVVTPVAANQMLANAGVVEGVVAIKTDGDWQAVPASEPLVVPVGLDNEDVQIRLIPSDLSKPVVSQSVDLKRVGTQPLLSVEELAALVPVSQSDDSSSLTWLLYVAIGVLAIAAAFLFGQRRKASAS